MEGGNIGIRPDWNGIGLDLIVQLLRGGVLTAPDLKTALGAVIILPEVRAPAVAGLCFTAASAVSITALLPRAILTPCAQDVGAGVANIRLREAGNEVVREPRIVLDTPIEKPCSNAFVVAGDLL